MGLLDLLTSCLNPKPTDTAPTPSYRLHEPPKAVEKSGESVGERRPKYNVVGNVQPVKPAVEYGQTVGREEQFDKVAVEGRNRKVGAQTGSEPNPNASVLAVSKDPVANAASISKSSVTDNTASSAPIVPKPNALDSFMSNSSIEAEALNQEKEEGSPYTQTEGLKDPLMEVAEDKDASPCEVRGELEMDENLRSTEQDGGVVEQQHQTTDQSGIIDRMEMATIEDEIKLEPITTLPDPKPCQTGTLALPEAIAQAEQDPLTHNFNPALFRKTFPFWPPQPPKEPLMVPRFRPTESAAEMADQLVDVWTRTAERRVANGINVCHLVDYFEDAIIQQFL